MTPRFSIVTPGLRPTRRRAAGDDRVGRPPRRSTTGSCAWSTTARRRRTWPRCSPRPPRPTPGCASPAARRTAASWPRPTTPWPWRRASSWCCSTTTTTLHPEALRLVDDALDGPPEADYLYSDEDKIDGHGRLSGPFYKPDWSPERFRTQMYTCHVAVLRRSLVEEVGGFDPAFEGSQDWDLVAAGDRAGPARSSTCPRCCTTGALLAASTAGEGEAAKPYAYDAGTRALQAHCERIGMRGRRRARPRAQRRLPPAPGAAAPPAGQHRDPHRGATSARSGPS